MIRFAVVCLLVSVAFGAGEIARAADPDRPSGSAGALGAAAPAVSGAGQAARSKERSVDEWLIRLQEGSRKRAFQGTFVVSSASGAQSSARIWHVCDGEQQLERVDALTGPPRSTFRRNADVVTFWPRAGVAQTEKREALAVFPGFLQTTDNAIARFYTVKLLGADRVAGLQSDLIELVPQDGYRYGYRVWSEKSTGMLLKVQTMDAAGRVMEQSAFSEVELDAPVSMETLKTAMGRTEGYRMVERSVASTTADAEGWTLKAGVPGFKGMSCFRRTTPATSASSPQMMHWVFSDGLASVSLFVEAFDPRRHVGESVLLDGATRTLTKRLTDRRGGQWWLTAVGEVPTRTLQAFAGSLERSR